MRARIDRRATAPRAVVTLLATGLLLPLSTGHFSPAVAEADDSPQAVRLNRSLIGSYLSGRFARSLNDTDSAATFYNSALMFDPASEMLLEQALLMEATRGSWSEALRMADELISLQPQHRMAQLIRGLAEFKSGSWKKAEQHFKAASSGPIGELTSALVLAWVKLAENNSAAALDLLIVPKQAEWAQFYLRYHRALIADAAGRKSDAKAAFDKVFKQDSRTLRTALAYARSAANGGDVKAARTILKEHLDKSQGEGHPLARDLQAQIQTGAKIPLLVTTPSDGLTEVFYGLGEALIGEGAVGVGILYLQMALYVTPNHPFALAALANAYESNKQYAEAIDIYDRIPKASPLEPAIEIRKAFNLNSLERTDEARAVLTKLLDNANATPDTPAAADTPAAPAQTPSSDAGIPDLGGKVLKVGSDGDAVRDVQGALANLGYDIGGAVDGKFGEATRNAVLAFQEKSGLGADGLVGQETLAAILNGAPDTTPAAAALATPPVDPSQPRKIALDLSERLQALDALGNILRSRKLYTEAVEIYDRAISLIPKPDKRHWSYFYARGTSYERMKQWPSAEKDLKKALALVPDQPLVLNYLGYSWIDQGLNLREGMALIEKAVAAKPDDGYIVDSLGWAHFKLGNFKEAVRYLERAVELRPDDPVLNDHLGDALWRVGREREAKFQWDQSLSLKPEPEDEAKIRKKLEQGLASLSEEAKTATAVNDAAQDDAAKPTTP